MKFLTLLIIMQLLSGCMVMDTLNNIKSNYSWNSENVDHQESWQAAGVNTPMEAKAWMKIGVNRFTVHHWTKRGVKPAEAKNWRKSGLDNDRIFGYLDAGVTSPDDAKKWNRVSRKCGADAKGCLKIGINNPVEAEKWFKVGFSKEQMSTYTAFGITSSNQAVEWYHAGANEEVIKKWTKKGFKPKDVEHRVVKLVEKNREWDSLKRKEFFYHKDDLKLWRKTNYTPKEILVWVNADLRKGHNWINAGVTNISEVKKWVKAGIPKGYDWINAGIKNLSDAKQWKKIGLNPVLTPYVKKQGFNRNKLAKSCGNIVSSASFTSNNPYKYKNKCVLACVEVNQILSTNKIFGDIVDKRVVSVTAPSKLLADFSVGDVACGIYKVQDANDFSLLNSQTVKGNSLKSIMNIDSRIYLLNNLTPQ